MSQSQQIQKCDESTASLDNSDTQIPTQPGPIQMFACYLLVSISPKSASKNRTYVGFTVNPSRRIRQHNGEITAGARRTSQHRPWQMIALVHGFSSKIHAMQFEWAWQNPHLCISLKYQSTRPDALPPAPKGARTPNSRLRSLAALLSVPPWSRCPLTITITALREDWSKWKIDEIVFPRHKNVEFASLDHILSGAYDYRREVATVPKRGPCSVCQQPKNDRAESFCATCGANAHLSCIAKCCAESGDHMIPDWIKCPACDAMLHWSLVVRMCRTLEGDD